MWSKTLTCIACINQREERARFEYLTETANHIEANDNQLDNQTEQNCMKLAMSAGEKRQSYMEQIDDSYT